MKGTEWLASGNPARELAYLPGKVSERKLRLFGCACCRSIWRLLRDACGQQAVEVAERFADGAAARRALNKAYLNAYAARTAASVAAGLGPLYLALSAAMNVANKGYFGRYDVSRAQSVALECAQALHREGSSEPEQAAQLGLLRCIFGNPFHPVAVDPAWRTPTVVSLAGAAYEERLMPSGALDLARVGVLSDALEEVGCTDASILDHLRGPGPHVRGCWVVDLFLGKD